MPQDQRMQKIIEFQTTIEKKLVNFKNITFKHFLMAWICSSGVQALVQFLTIKSPNPWEDKQVLEFYNDPAFYLGLMLTFMIALLIIRKWERLEN